MKFPCRKGRLPTPVFLGFPGGSESKESACNAGDPSSFLGSGRSAGERIGYPLQYSWASLVAQLVKNPPAMREIWVRSLGCEDPRRRERLCTPVYWPGEFLENSKSMGSQRVGHNFGTEHQITTLSCIRSLRFVND